MLATVVNFRPSYLHRALKVPTLTDMRLLGVAILETVVIYRPSYLRRLSEVPALTGVRPLGITILETVLALDPHICVILIVK